MPKTPSFYAPSLKQFPNPPKSFLPDVFFKNFKDQLAALEVPKASKKHLMKKNLCELIESEQTNVLQN
jgi:hypothetical protein